MDRQAGGPLPALVPRVGEHPAADRAEGLDRVPAADDAPRGAILGRTGIGAAILALALSAAGLKIWQVVDERTKATHARALVRGLLTADTANVRPIIREIEDYRRWTLPELERAFRDSPDDSTPKLHACLALLPYDPGRIDFLYSRLLAADLTAMAMLRDSLQANRAGLIPRLWADSARRGTVTCESSLLLAPWRSTTRRLPVGHESAIRSRGPWCEPR